MPTHDHLIGLIIDFNEFYADHARLLEQFSENRNEQNFQALAEVACRLETLILRLNNWNLSVLLDL